MKREVRSLSILSLYRLVRIEFFKCLELYILRRDTRVIQELTGAVYHNEYRTIEPESGDYIMFVKGRSVLVKKSVLAGNGILEYLKLEELVKAKAECVAAANKKTGISENDGNSENIKDNMKFTYLFQIETSKGTMKFFLGENDKLPSSLLNICSYEPQNIFREKKPDYMAFAGVTACQLANWYVSTRYCGACGALLEHDKKERMMRCPKCGAMHYPKISPAVIVAVTDSDKLLMTKYAGRAYTKYALIAGFAEIGETIEETVRREVMEEVGLKVKNIRYYKSQPWSFTDTMLFGFFCELDGDDTIRLDEEELSVGKWLRREEIPTEYDGISLTNEMIMRFKNGEHYGS